MTESPRVVTATGLGKRYTMRRPSGEAYSTLRDGLASALRRVSGRNGIDRGEEGREFWALRDVSFDVDRGDVVGIIGRNGAGKSTLLKVLSRITEPTTGAVRIRGRVASLLEVGTGFHPELTGRENIFLNGAILGMSRAEILKRFDEIVDFAEVERFLDMPVKRYSSGMYVRLAFAVAANLEPEILIVDEVLAVGDAQFQRKCLGKMRDVSREEGRTVLFVSHSMASVRALCNRAIWLDAGRIRMNGPSLDVIRGYLDSTVDVSAPTVDLVDVRRPPGLADRLMVERVTLNDGAPVLHGEAFRIAIEYRVRSEVQSVAFGVGFSSLEGVRLMSIDSDLGGERLDLLPAATRRIEASVPRLNLQPGRYALDVAARSGENGGLDYLPACIWVDVLPGPATPAVIIREGGGVREPAEWDWKGTERMK